MAEQRKQLLLVGLGRWGSIFLKNLFSHPKAELAGVVTSRPDAVKEKLPAGCKVFADLTDALPHQWDGIIFATPPAVHGPQLQLAMKAGIPALMEKPLCLNPAEADELWKLEKDLKARVLVDHVQLFHSGYEQLWTKAHEASSLSIESEGGGPGPFRDYSAIWDYGSHDLSMILDLMGELPIEVHCRKTDEKAVAGGLGENFETKLRFRRGQASFRSGTLFPEKTRSFHVEWEGNSGTYVDFPEPRLFLQRIGEKESRASSLVDAEKPLERALNIFITGLEPNSVLDRRWGLELGVRVVKTLAACDSSLRNMGPVAIA